MNNPIKMPNRLLNQHQQDKIDNVINDIFAKHEANTDQYSHIENIIKDEKIKITEKEFGEDLSGMLLRDGDSWRIIVNKGDSIKRKIFTIAHELGHYFLHRDQRDEFIDGMYTQSFTRSEAEKYKDQEVEANEFAGQLIMPKQIIEREFAGLSKIDISNVNNLSAKLGVSNFAMTTRLRNLDYVV